MPEACSLPTTYLRRFYVTSHASDRFRERLAEGSGLRHVPDLSTLGDFLDTRVATALDMGRVEHIIDMGRPSRVVNVSADDVGSLYALLRPNDFVGSVYEWAIITVLSGPMYTRSMRSGGWRRVTEEEFAHALASASNANPAAPGPVVTTCEASPELPPTQDTPTGEPDAWLLTWAEKDGAERSRRATTRAEVHDAVTSACLAGAYDFRLYVEVPLTVRRQVDVEF